MLTRRRVEFDPRGLATLPTIVKQGTKIPSDRYTVCPFKANFGEVGESSESRRFEADRTMSCVRSEMGSAKYGSNQNRAACLFSEAGVQLTSPSPALEQPTVPHPYLGSCRAWMAHTQRRERAESGDKDRINELQLFRSSARVAVVPGSRHHYGGRTMGRANRHVDIKVS